MAGETILFVSDDSEDRELYSEGLAFHGFHVNTADGLGAIRSAADHLHPSALVLSLELGNAATWTALEELQCGTTMGVPGVLLTAWVRPNGENRTRALDLGCAAFVAKPCTPDALAAVLTAVLSGARGLVVMNGAQCGRDSDETREP